MFYAEELLSRRRGKFGIIWLAATLGSGKAVSLTRRDYQKIVITTACNEIQNLVVPKQALALRLSSNLLFGVARVFYQQTTYVWVDTRQVWGKVRAMTDGRRETADIDLPAHAMKSLEPLDLVSHHVTLAWSDFNLFIDNTDIHALTVDTMPRFGLPPSLQMEQVWTLDSPSLHGPGKLKDGQTVEESLASLLDATADVSMGTLEDIKVPNDEDFAGPTITDPSVAGLQPSTHAEENVNLLEDDHDPLSMSGFLDENGLFVPTADLVNLLPDGQEPALPGQPDIGLDQSGMVQTAESTTSTVSTTNFTLPPLPKTPPKSKKKLRGPIVDSQTSLTNKQIHKNLKRADHLLVSYQPQAYFNYPTPADHFTQPACKLGQSLTKTWKRGAVVSKENRFSTFSNLDAEAAGWDVSGDASAYAGGLDDTLESVERARHLDSQADNGMVSLGGSDLSVSRSKSSMMIDAAPGGFPVGRPSLDNLSGLLREGAVSPITAGDSHSRNRTSSRQHRFSTIASPLHQIAEEETESRMLAGYDAEYTTDPMSFSTGADWLKQQDSVKDFLSFLDSSMTGREMVSFHGLVPPRHIDRKTAATAMATLLTLASENVVGLTQDVASQSFLITRGPEF